ncbi:lysine transporter LysE [Solihabitans fulvus]|uniref:Lysine transporter LysE n=1 Tax=Solihabitans fulvus TaxID=1892852 RepID=A0A5B2WNV7_9PSEU|nr:LysE family transporter [Solihabitans fulvus]KAA2252688.1 lysine transporter LysE [Solihabitans fulvus]
MTAALLAGLVAGYGVAIPVGGVGVLLVGLSARTSLRVGAAAALGVATADGLYAVAAALGGSAAGQAIAPYAGYMRLVAALVLTALAVRTAATALRRHRAPEAAEFRPVTPARAFAGLLGVTLLNPATILYFAALVLGRQATGAFTPPELAAFVLAAFAASTSWQLLLASGGSLLGRVLTGRRGSLLAALASSVAIVAMAAAIVFQ